MLTIKLPQIFRVHQVPRIFWEDGIISGYRHPRSSAFDCILSSFQMTNETVNIWTHFLPTWYFLWRFLVLSSSLDFCRDAYNWPFLVYLLLVCLYPFTSSCAHTFSTMSTHARHICYFFDYGALSLYSLVSQNWSVPGSARFYGQRPLCIPLSMTISHCFIGSCSALGTTAPGTTPSPATSTTSSLPCSPASSLPPTCRNAWHPGASTTLGTATSCSTSVRWWAPTSSWRPSCRTCAHARPG